MGGHVDEQILPGQYAIVAHNSAMVYAKNKQIRQPVSQANCMLDPCCIIVFYHFFAFIHHVWKEQNTVWFYFEKTVVPGKTGCKAKGIFEVFHLRMPSSFQILC